MKKVSTITIAFKYTHRNGEAIDSVRSFVEKLSNYCEDSFEILSNDDAGDYTFIKHDGKYSHQFKFNSIDSFLEKYAKFGAGELASVLHDYSSIVGCESKTEEVADMKDAVND